MTLYIADEKVSYARFLGITASLRSSAVNMAIRLLSSGLPFGDRSRWLFYGQYLRASNNDMVRLL